MADNHSMTNISTSLTKKRQKGWERKKENKEEKREKERKNPKNKTIIQNNIPRCFSVAKNFKDRIS